MKKFCLLSMLFSGFFTVYSQTPITLTFQAKDSLTQNSLALDSVNVKNLAENCDTTLYEAVSVLDIVALWPVGITDPAAGSTGSFTVMQNAPNPFRGSTLVRIYIRNAGELNLAVYDSRGKQLSEYHNRFEKGWRLFGISTSEPGMLFLKVSDNTEIKTIKIVSANAGHEGERISCLGQPGQGSALKSVADAAGFVYYLGNQLQYTAYAGGYHEATLLDSPSSGETYTFAMLPEVFTCGASITINHVAGAVVPVNKTVTYGTVANIPGEASKCWITSNLGADRQATAKNDATEASAGWYWQFNRKQGYKHDGVTRTPNTTWITPISENSDWTPANDPCTLELGTGWRIPTKSEWINVNETGNWTNWDDPWNSALKMHAAGNLGSAGGLLYERGSTGFYWSSTQENSTLARVMMFWDSGSNELGVSKANGHSIRCVHD
jgi:hypothetical protein